jgi:transcriptional regulator with XRE-family HTH domain
VGRTARADNPYAEHAARLAGALRAARERRGMSREELARRSGISTATLTKIESRATHDPGFFTVARLAEVLRVGLDELAARARGDR